MLCAALDPASSAGLQQLLLLCLARLAVLTCIGAASYRALSRGRRSDSPTPGSGSSVPSPRTSLTQAALCLQLAWLATELVLGSGLLVLQPYLLGEGSCHPTERGAFRESSWQARMRRAPPHAATAPHACPAGAPSNLFPALPSALWLCTYRTPLPPLSIMAPCPPTLPTLPTASAPCYARNLAAPENALRGPPYCRPAAAPSRTD